jgi:F-type H+-transporting ATPase subunit b
MNLVTPAIGTIFFMTLVFLILFFLLSKYAWKPILSSIKDREQKIADSLAMANQARSEMMKLKSDNEKLLHQAAQERELILKQANTLKDNIISEAKTKAQQEADRIIESARLNIHNEKLAAIHQLKKQVADLSLEMAEKIIKTELSNSEKHRDFVEKQIDQINFN